MPKEQLHESFAAADVFLVSLKPGLEGYIVPSKLYGILAAGRPYVAAVDPSCEAAAIACEHGCGVVADPGVSDRSKLALLLGRLPAREDAPLGELVRRAEGDAETRALLETIVDDERATVRWLRGMRDALEREGA